MCFRGAWLTRAGYQRNVDRLASRSHTRLVVKVTKVWVIGGVLAALAACGGGADSQTFTRSDALEIIGTAPSKPAGWSWTKDGGIKRYTLADLRALPEIQHPGGFRDAVDGLAAAGYEGWFKQFWAARGTSAEGEAALFSDTSGAKEGFAHLQRLTPGWFLPVPVDGLGDEAVSSATEFGAGYIWRRGNLVVDAWVLRATGPFFDFGAAARVFADALDEQLSAR